MPLTAAQLTTLKNDINADPTLSAYPNNVDGNIAIAQAYNLLAAPDFFVYRTNAPVAEIFDQVTWANFTPADAPDTTVQWTNRSLACQGKQFNLQIITQGRETVNAAKTNIRAGLQDALTGLPSGTGGTTRTANWVGVRDNVLARKATRAEKLFASGGTGANAQNAATMGVEGDLQYTDVELARNS